MRDIYGATARNTFIDTALISCHIYESMKETRKWDWTKYRTKTSQKACAKDFVQSSFSVWSCSRQTNGIRSHCKKLRFQTMFSVRALHSEPTAPFDTNYFTHNRKGEEKIMSVGKPFDPAVLKVLRKRIATVSATPSVQECPTSSSDENVPSVPEK